MEIMSHDLLPKSILFDGDLPTKTDKSTMVKTLESHLKPEDIIFPGGEFIVILDFMSKIRSIQNLSSFKCFCEAVNRVLSAGKRDCFRSSLHVVFDSYVETSINSVERFRRCLGKDALDLTAILEDTPIPQQLEKFWSSAATRLTFSDWLAG